MLLDGAAAQNERKIFNLSRIGFYDMARKQMD